MHPFHHAKSAAKKWGGDASEYLEIEAWFDASKEHMADYRHRALRHHTQGIFEAERVFGKVLTLSTGKEVPIRYIGERHVQEDCMGRIPNLADWLRLIKPERWMATPGKAR